MHFTKFFQVIVFSGFVVACATPPAPTLTPIQKQQIQSRTYDSGHKKEDLFNAVVTVFQDKGYIIENAHLDTGIVTATSESTNTTDFWQALGGTSSQMKTKITATVQKYGQGTRVRLNLLNVSNSKTKSCNGWGICNTDTNSSDKVIYDNQVYTAIFNAIDDALFVIGSGGTEMTN